MQPAPGVRSKEKLVELPSELDKGPEDTAVDLSSNSFEVRLSSILGGGPVIPYL